MTTDDAAKQMIERTLKDLDSIVNAAVTIAEKVHIMVNCEVSRLHTNGNSIENLKNEFAEILIKEITQRLVLCE